MVGVVGLEPTYGSFKGCCLNQLGDTPTNGKEMTSFSLPLSRISGERADYIGVLGPESARQVSRIVFQPRLFLLNLAEFLHLGLDSGSFSNFLGIL